MTYLNYTFVSKKIQNTILIQFNILIINYSPKKNYKFLSSKSFNNSKF